MTVQKSLNFFIIKIVFADKSFVVLGLLCQNNLVTTTALTGKSYVPELQKINMFVNLGVKVRGLVAEAPKTVLSPAKETSKLGKILTL